MKLVCEHEILRRDILLSIVSLLATIAQVGDCNLRVIDWRYLLIY